MVNNELNPQGPSYTPEDLNRFLDESSQRQASYNSILRGAKAMGFDQDSVRKTMYNRSEQRREDQMQTYAEDLINLRMEKQRIAAANDRLKELEALKKKGQGESELTPDGGGSASSLSQQVIDADQAFLTEWDKRQLLLDYEKAINTNDNNFEVQRLQNEINNVFGVELGYEKKEGLEKAFEDMSNISAARNIEDDDPRDYFGKTGKDIAVGFGKIIDFINPASIAGQLGTLAMEMGKPVDFNPEEYEPNFEESRQFIASELEKANANLMQSISSHNDINTQLGYAPNFDPNSRADMEAMYSEIIQRNFNTDPELQDLANELAHQRGLDRGYINHMVRGMLDRRAASAIQAMDSVAEMFKEGGLSGMGAEGLENWADRAGIRDSARQRIMLGDDAFNDKGIVESFLDGEIANGFKKFGVAAPDLISQVATLVLTKGKARTAAIGWMGVQAGGNYYSQIKRREDLSSSEKFAQSVAIGAAEMTLEKLFIGAEDMARQGLKKVKSPKSLLRKKRDNLDKALSDFREGRLSVGKEAIKGFGAEALEEGLMSLVEQNLETVYDIANGKKTAADAMKGFNGYEFADSLFLGGIMGSGTRSIGAMASNIGHRLVIKKVEEKRGKLKAAEEAYNKETDPILRDLYRQQILDAQADLYNLHSVGDRIYGRFSVEDGDKVIALNQKLSKLRDDINETDDRNLKNQLTEEFKALYQQKSEIESKYVTEADIQEIEDETPFEEAELRKEEEKARENGGQYEMTFPDESGKPQTVEERAIAANEVRAQQALEANKEKSEKQSQDQDRADAELQNKDAAETQAQDQPSDTGQVQEAPTQQTEEDAIRSEGELIELTPNDLIGKALSSVTVSNVNKALRGLAPVIGKLKPKVVLHRTQESFDGSNAGNTQQMGAYYNPNTNEVHLRPDTSVEDIREEFGHAIFSSLIGVDADPRGRQNLFDQAKKMLDPQLFQRYVDGYTKYYTNTIVGEGKQATPEQAKLINAKVQEEVILKVIRETPTSGLSNLRFLYNRIVSSLFGKEFIVRSNDDLKTIAFKYQSAMSHSKSTLDVEGAVVPSKGVVSASLKSNDPIAGKTIYASVNLRENRFGDRSERPGVENVRGYKFNDYRHFSNWYAKITGNHNEAYVGRIGRMYYIDADGSKVEVKPPAPVLNRDGSRKYVQAQESDRVRYHRLRYENRVRQAETSREYTGIRKVLQDVMNRYDIKGEIKSLSEFGNTREGLIDARNTVMDILDRRGSKMDTGKLVSTLSSMDVSDGNVTFINRDGFTANPKGVGAPLLITSNSVSLPLDQLSADAIKAFVDANVVEMEMADGIVGVAINGDTATITMNHAIPQVYKETLLEFAEKEGMPSVYSTMDGEAIPVSDSSTYKGIGRRDAVVDAVADLKQNKLPSRKNVKPLVSPAAGTVENLGVISPSLKQVQEAADRKPDVSIGSGSQSVLAMGKALVTKIGEKLVNTVAEGSRSGVAVANLKDPELIKRLDGCEYITVAYDQTGHTKVVIEGKAYNINSGVRLAKGGEIMSHRNNETRDETARALEKAAARAKAKGKEVVILYTGMEGSGLKSNPFVARAVMEHALKVAKDLGIEQQFFSAFSQSLTHLHRSGDLGVRFGDSLSFFAFDNGAFNEDTGEFDITTADQFNAIVDSVSAPRGGTSQADFEATFNARELIVDVLTNRSRGARSKSVASKIISPKTSEFLERTINNNEIVGFADPALSNQGKGLAKSGDVVALQFVDPSNIVNDNGATKMSWRRQSFKTEPKNAFQFTIQGGEGIQFTSHHVSLAVWAPEIMKGRAPGTTIGTVAKGKQQGSLSFERPADSPQAEIEMGVKTAAPVSPALRMDSSTNQPSGQFQQRERSKYQLAKDVVIRKLQNKFRELMVLQEDVEAFRGQLDESEDFRLKETLFYGKAANDLDLLDKKVTGLKQTMKDTGITSEELGEYMYALHAKERNALIKERDGVENGSGMTDAEAQQILDRIDPEQKAKLEKNAKILREIMQETRDTLRKFGLNTKEEVDKFESQFENYIPLAGIAKDEQIDGSAYPTGGAGLAVYKSPVKKAKGRKYRAQEVVAQVIAQSANTLIHARKNEALEALHNMVVNNPNPAVWQVVGVAEYGDKSVVPVRIGGKKKYIKFNNTHYADSLNGMTVEKTNTFIKILRAPSNWLRRSFTTLDPEFVISNFARDIQSAIFNATADAELDGNGMNGPEVRGRIMRSVFPLMKSLLRDAAGKDMSPEHRMFYEEFKADGGKTGWAYAKPLEDIAADLQSNPDTAAKKVLGSISKVTDFIEGVNDAVENSIRLASYIAARENGVSREKAAVFAKNITVNFNKSGEMGQVANAIYLFFNASVQGTARIAKSMTLKPKFKDNGQQRSWQERITGAQKLAMSLTLVNAMLAAINESFSDDDEDGKSFYSKISDYEKERNMIIMLDGKNYIKIPMPYGYNVFANMGTAVSEVSMGTREIDDALMFLLSSAFGSFSPISFGQSKDVYGMLEKGLAPTVAKPFIEVANNETFFGSQVYAKQFPGATPKPDSQMSFRAPKYLRDLFEFMNEASGGSEFKSGWFDKNPDKAWYLFEYFLGGAGRFVTRTGEVVQKAGNKAFVDGDVDLEFNDAPILRKMYGEASRYYDYDLFEKNSVELGQLHKEMKNLGFDASKHQSVHMLNENLKRAKKQLKILREKRREARQIEGYAERTIRLQELMEKERQIMMNFNKLYEERRK